MIVGMNFSNRESAMKTEYLKPSPRLELLTSKQKKMQEYWTFEFPKTDDPSAQLSRILTKEEKELGIFLSYYYKKEGALAEKVNLKGEPQFVDAYSGNLVLDFDLVHFNACLAIHEQKREEMSLTFEIDLERGKLKLLGPYWPSREMDEI